MAIDDPDDPHRRLRARGTPGAAPRGGAVDRTRGHHRGRVSPAAPRTRRPRRRLDVAARWSRPRTPSSSSPGSPRRPARRCSTALIQRRDRPDPATYIGSGKATELRDIVVADGADTVICDGELTPGQLRQLEAVVKVKVVDRTALILDIFAQHARSKEGKAQVELAQMQYMLPRLRGWGESLSRQVGGRAAGGVGIGGRGPGETKIEIDRRRINTRMAKLRRELADMKTARDVKRSRRDRERGAQRRARRLHQRGQVVTAQPAHRRRRARRERAVRHPRPDGAARARPRTAGCTRWPTPSASSGTCPRSWSRRSARHWRRSPTPT